MQQVIHAKTSGAGLDGIGYARGARVNLGVYGAGQAVHRVVGQGNDVVLRLKLGNGDNGPKYILERNSYSRRNVSADGGRDVVAFTRGCPIRPDGSFQISPVQSHH